MLRTLNPPRTGCSPPPPRMPHSQGVLTPLLSAGPEPETTAWLRLAGTSRDHLVQALSEQGQQEHVAQDCVLACSEYLHGRRPHRFSGQPKFCLSACAHYLWACCWATLRRTLCQARLAGWVELSRHATRAQHCTSEVSASWPSRAEAPRQGTPPGTCCLLSEGGAQTWPFENQEQKCSFT